MKRRRKELRLASGEIEILEILWQAGSATISEAHDAHVRKIGYTTVQTRLNRLVEKGLVRNPALTRRRTKQSFNRSMSAGTI